MRRLFLAVLLLTGCYRYAPAPNASVAPGMQVRISLSPTPDSSVRAILGASTTGLEGRVVRVSDSAWAVAVDGTYKRRSNSPQDRTNWAGETVNLPLASIGSIEQRSVDRRRTTRAIVIGAVGAIILVRLAVLAVDASSGGDDGGPIVTPP